jgi:hypothetical protein
MTMRSWPLRVLAVAVLLVGAAAALPRSADAQLNVTGQWSTLSALSPLNPIHVALLKNGKILIVGGSENNENNTVFKAAVFNPANNSFSQQTTPWDLFCNGMSFLADGRVIMTGGNVQYDPFFGPPWTTIFDPATEKFYRVEDMAEGRWYPTNQLLQDGGTMVFGGLDEQGFTNNTVEIYDIGGGWSPQYTAPFAPGWYPRLHLLGNGKVFMSGPNAQSRTFDPSQGTWSASGATTKYGIDRLYGSSVLLPLEPNEGYRPRVVIFGGDTHGATKTVELIDLGASIETWVNLPPMSVPRVHLNAVLLPNGKILTLGGSTLFDDASTAHLNTETFDPVAQTWTSSGNMAFARLYHSTALLLPDATVWVAGSNPTRSAWTPQIEIYKPPYLFTSTGALAPRPTISAVPAKVGHGQTFTLTTPDAANISKVVFMRPGSNTHAFDSEQRMLNTFFTKQSGALTVTAPTLQGAPPGYYMVFIINASGVPSVAKFVQVLPNATNQPPTATISSPSSGNVTIQAGQSVTFAGSANDPDGSVALYSWIFPGGSPGKSSVQNPGAVTFATPGVYTASLTVLDNTGANNPSPPTVTVTVNGAAPLGASITSPASGSSVSGTVAVNMSASNIQGSPTQFVLKLDNSTTLSTQSVPSGSTASFQWNTAGVSNGAHTLNLTVTDGAGRTASSAVSVTVANGTGGAPGAPTVSITTPFNGDWTGNSLHIVATASGGSTALSSVKLYGNGGVVLQTTCTGTSCTLDDWWTTGTLSPGGYQIQAVATNTAGVWTTSAPVTIYKDATTPVKASGAPPSGGGGGGGGDTTAPTVAISGPAGGATVTGTTSVTASASDNVGVVGVQFKLDGANLGAEDTSAPYSVSWNTTTAANGTHTLTAVARDAAGNTTTSTAVTVTVSNTTGGGDTTSPTVAITGPAGGATVSGTAQVSASASDNVGVVGVQFKLDGANLGAEDTSAPYAVSWNTTTAANGTHILTAVARDAAGNTTTSAAVTVTVSNSTGGGGEAPTVSITTPFDGDWTGNSLHIAATASGGTTALTSVKIYGNGGVVLETTCSGTSCTLDDWWTTGVLPDGGYQIQAVATNSAGVWTTSPPITIYKNATTPVVASGAPPSGSGGGDPPPPPPPPPPTGGGDTTAPTVAITSPASGKTIGSSIKVSAKGVDNVMMASLKLYGNGVLFAQKVCDRASCTLTGTWQTSTLPSGQHTITAVGTDTAGNTTTSPPITVNK